MDKIKTLFTLAATALLAASCIKDEPACSTCDDNPDGRGILLSFVSGTDTRSNLYSSEVDYRDVQDVYLYVFNGTDGNAECILSKDVDWQGDISQTYWIGTDLDADSYTFLAVGVDDKAGSVYGLTADYKGTLGQCMAKLAADKGKADMATAQFFVGHTTRTVDKEEDVVDVEVTLTRKVSGVLAYLKNIPYQVDFSGANGKATVTDLRISLGSAQNTQMPLWTASAGKAYGSVSLSGDNKVLFQVNLQQAGYTPDKDSRYYTKAGTNTDALQTVDNSLLMGAFLLPLELEEGTESTLKLELLGSYTTGTGEDYQDVVVKTYIIQNNEGKAAFPIDENKLYCIGKKLSDASTNGDKPADLSGNILVVNIEKWKCIPVDNNFPTVTGPARIESDYNQDVYIFNTAGSEFPLYLHAAEPVAGWELKVNYYSGNDDAFKDITPGSYEATDPQTNWIHFVATDEEGKPTGYASTLSDPEGADKTITVVLNDFAEQRKLEGSGGYYIETSDLVNNLKNDYRTAYIEVHTDGTQEPYRLLVRQYNALTVYVGQRTEEPNAFRAASRLDYGCYFDKETGQVVRSDTAAVGWGYWSSVPYYITGDTYETDYWLGSTNTIKAYDRYKKDSYGGKNYSGSLYQKLRKVVIKITADGSYTPDEEKIWCLPAYHEMWGVADYINPYRDTGDACQDLFNMKQGDNYWCSTIKDDDINESLYIPAGTTTYMQEADRDDKLFARPIRQFYNN